MEYLGLPSLLSSLLSVALAAEVDTSSARLTSEELVRFLKKLWLVELPRSLIFTLTMRHFSV